MPLQGQCNCAAITVSIKDGVAKSESTAYCHCSNCRRQSGALGTFVMAVPEDDATVTGSPRVYVDKDSDSGTPVHRWFCGDCGCPVMSTSPVFAGLKLIKLGLFDKIPKPAAEYYCKNKNEWEVAPEGTLQVQTAT